MPPSATLDKLRSARLYLLLTRDLCRLPPLSVLSAAVDAGVGLVQVREPGMPGGALMEWVREVRRAASPRGVPVIVNDRADVALASGADGVHLGQADLSSRDVRMIGGRHLLIGLSTHGRAEIEHAEELPVDYCGLGPVFDTATKGLEGKGLELLRECLPLSRKPTFVIGGVSVENAAMLAAAGAERLAVSRAICAAEDPGEAARVLRAALA
jgi:thiamine-phosphate pyrophosphorylase